MLRLGFGEGASGGVSLAKAYELSESFDEDCPAWVLAGLHKVWRKLKYHTLVILSVFGFRVLTILPGAGPWDPTPGCYW